MSQADILEEKMTNQPDALRNQYCQVQLHPTGQIQIQGDKETVRYLIGAFKKAGYKIRWNYHSPCG
jgi:hypothetical protein